MVIYSKGHEITHGKNSKFLNRMERDSALQYQLLAYGLSIKDFIQKGLIAFPVLTG